MEQRAPTPPSGLKRLVLRIPVLFFTARLGWLLGERFLMLTHTGRRSGKRYQTVVEVVRHDREADTYFVVSGWGERADWYRNIVKTPQVTVRVGGRRFEGTAVPLPEKESDAELRKYAQAHRRLAPALLRLIGYGTTGRPEE